jgi:hypothetical protein
MIQAIVGLGRVATSPLKGRAQNWRTALVVTDRAGETVVKVAFGKLARPAYAVFDTAGGRWTIEQGGRARHSRGSKARRS